MTVSVNATNADDGASHVPVALKASTGWVAGLGATFGLGALISSSCCAVPLALAGLGAGGAVFSGLEFLAQWRLYLLGAASLALLASWVMFFRHRAVACNTGASCARPAPTKRTVAALSIGTAFVALALVWDALIEPIVFKLVR
jgi:mercuric ion transport protein